MTCLKIIDTMTCWHPCRCYDHAIQFRLVTTGTNFNYAWYILTAPLHFVRRAYTLLLEAIFAGRQRAVQPRKLIICGVVTIFQPATYRNDIWIGGIATGFIVFHSDLPPSCAAFIACWLPSVIHIIASSQLLPLFGGFVHAWFVNSLEHSICAFVMVAISGRSPPYFHVLIVFLWMTLCQFLVHALAPRFDCQSLFFENSSKT